MKGILASVDKRILSLRYKLSNEIAETEKGHHEELNLGIQETQIDIRIVRTLVEATRRGLEARLVEFEARADHGPCESTGIGIDSVKPPKFGGSISWAGFRRQFEAVAGYNN